jgi:hypothetical protein
MNKIRRQDVPDEPIRITQTPGGVVPLATRDGVPVCAYCGGLMVEIDDDFWQCPAAGAELDAAIDQLLRLFGEQLPDLPGDP